MQVALNAKDEFISYLKEENKQLKLDVKALMYPEVSPETTEFDQRPIVTRGNIRSYLENRDRLKRESETAQG